jgi:hypothetical protein
VAPERADRVWEAIALHTSAGIASRMAAEIALVHLGAGLDFLGLGLDQVPPQLLEEILTSYPRLNFKSSAGKKLSWIRTERSLVKNFVS